MQAIPQQQLNGKRNETWKTEKGKHPRKKKPQVFDVQHELEAR
jgi:hypothetical protein